MTDEESPQLVPLTADEQQIIDDTVRAYQDSLTSEAASWLMARGITRDLGQAFRLGVVGPSVVRPDDEAKVGMVVIPYLDAQGRALTYRFRCIQDHDHRAHYHGKYTSRTHDPARMFNISAIHKAGEVLEVCEGEFDAMILTKLGYNAVAMPGATNWRPHHRVMVAGFSTVRVWADGDKAGADFMRTVTRSVRNARGVHLPLGKDVSDIYLQDGEAGITSLIGETK